MNDSFERLVPDADEIERTTRIEIEGREINVVAVAEDVIWFDFYAVCDGPRSQNRLHRTGPYEFHSVLISNIPVFDKQDDLARAFYPIWWMNSTIAVST